MPIVDIFPQIIRGKRLKKCNHTSGNKPYVSSTATNNGIDGFVGNTERVRVFDDCLTIANSGSVGSTFYHPYSFVASDHVTGLKRPGLDRYAYLFLATIISRVCEKYSFNREINDDRLKREKIVVPVDEQGNVDYGFMSAFMKQKEIQILKPTIEKIMCLPNTQRYNGGGNSIHPHWKPFQLSDIFVILPGKRLTKSDMTEGQRPFVGASDSNNGITAWVDNTNESLDANVLGVNYNGSVCETFYHPYECIFSDDVKRLHLKAGVDSKYIYLFLKTIILQQKCKYEYGYKFNEQRMLRQSILLPVSEDGNPDWVFMESFMRRLETKMLETTIGIFKKHINVNKCKLGGVKWKPISLLSLFEFSKGNQNNMSTLQDGDVPLVSAKKCDNGYKCFISPNSKPLFQGEILTLNLDGDGGAGISYYQPATMALDSHAGALKPILPINQYQMLFISRALTNQGDMFGHGYSINSNRVRSIKIMLPVNDEDNIDFDFMDSYMREIERTQILTYLNHIL